MKFLIIFIIIAHTFFISASHSSSKTESTIQKASAQDFKKFTKIDLDKTETVNEKNYPQEATPTVESNDIPDKLDIPSTTINNNDDKESHGKITTTLKPDIKPTKESKIPIDDEIFSTTISPKDAKKQPNENTDNVHNPGVVTDKNVQWFFGGAFAGIAVSFVAFYAYNFYKSRTESSYQNL